MANFQSRRRQRSATSFTFWKRYYFELILAGTLLLIGPATPIYIQAQSWMPVAPGGSRNLTNGLYRSGQVTDIDASVAGAPTALTTSWGGYFLGGILTFNPRSDTIPTGQMRSIARCPTDANTVVLATGSTPSTGSDNWGLGLYYTANAGVSWDRVVEAGPYSGGWRFEKVRWGSRNTVFAISNRGVYRSLANGAPNTWSTVFGYSPSGYTPSEDVLEIAVDPSLPTRIYVLTGDGRLLRSTQNGDAGSWTPLALPTERRDHSPFDSAQILRGSRLAIPKLNPRNLYLMVANSTGLYGMFHSTNFGDGSWSADDPGTCTIQPTMSMSGLAASPTRSEILLAAGGNNSNACRSSNGGLNWSLIGPGGVALHVDYRAVTFSPTGLALIGSDGGIFSSNDNGVYWFGGANLGLPAPVVGSFDVSAANPAFLYMATWDTGLWATVGRGFWTHLYDEDTRQVEADPTNALRAWAVVGNGGGDRRATVDGGLHFDDFNGNLTGSQPHTVIRTTGAWYLFTMHGNSVYRTTVPTGPRPIATPSWTKWPASTTPEFPGLVAGLAVNTPGRGDLFIYAWLTDNPDGTIPATKLYVFDGRTSNWRPSGGFPSDGGIIRVTTSATGQLAYVITQNNSIFTSSDYGVSWTNVTGNAPAEMYDVLIDPTNTSHVFVGTSGGVYQSISPGVWRNWSPGLPFANGAGARIAQLRTTRTGATTYLYAAVLGRGIFRRDIALEP